MKGYHKLRIETDGDIGYLGASLNIFLDDHQIYARNLRLDIEAGSVPEVYISLDVDQLEVSADAMVALKAFVYDSKESAKT